MPIIENRDLNTDQLSATEQAESTIPEELQKNFTPQQIEIIKPFLDQALCETHSFDIRFTIPFFNKKFYFVIFGGSGLKKVLEVFINRFYMTRPVKMFVTFSILSLLLFFMVLFYLIKSGLGIDLFPNMSFGLWEWIYHLFHE